MANELTVEQKREMFRQTATNPVLRAEFAASRALVIEPLLNTQSTIRSIFTVEDLGAGATAHYDIPFEDVDCVFLLPQIGGIPTVQVEGGEMTVDTFAVAGGVEYQRDIAADGRFQIAERSTQMLLNKFLVMEEICGWALIKTHAASLLPAQKVQAFANDGSAATAGSGKLNLFTMNEVETIADTIGLGGRQVKDLYVSPRRFNDLRNQLAVSALPDDIRKSLWNNGAGASDLSGIRIHKVYNKNLVPDNKAYAFTQKQGVTYGVMPFRQRLETYDNPIAFMERKVGILGHARYGLGVLDSLGLVEITF